MSLITKITAVAVGGVGGGDIEFINLIEQKISFVNML